MFKKSSCSLIGMVHVGPLPGAAGWAGNLDQIVENALLDAAIYKKSGFDAIMVENMHDVPYIKGHALPETVAAMTVISSALKREIKMPTGIQILAGANLEALGVAIAASLDFIRVEGFVYAHVGNGGIHESCAAKLIRRRDELKANDIKIFADVKKKHASHAITSDTSIGDTAKEAEFFKADGLVVTGIRTGDQPLLEEVKSVKQSVKIPVLVGSGITPENLKKYTRYSDGMIIGSSSKTGGHWSAKVDTERCKKLVSVHKD